MAFNDTDKRTMACDGTAKYTFRVAGHSEQIELTAVNELELALNEYAATVPSGYYDPKIGDNSCCFGLDFIASKLYEDLFGKSFYTRGGESVGLLTDFNENNFPRAVKLNAEYHPAVYFEEG